MKTEFFQNLTALDSGSQWQITVKPLPDNKLVVSVLFSSTCGDDAAKLVPPILLKGTAAELDEGFFIALTSPVQQTAALFSNMEAFMVQKDQAEKQSQMAKAEQGRQQKEQSEKGSKYDAAMKIVDALTAEGKFREAFIKLPDPAEFEGKAEIIRKRRTELTAKFSQPQLF
ncbi:PRTRC system protein E [Dyadobacter frigoris]|uniref:PRTRC system protein E n=1 Tax=Dyadobacter frigoris TaxID=2576211 RepID=A0A4U6CLJ1_9BACT|nr:PRTRC system protein E [Dyadobacter frigoris]TKT84896.1 PRTRC system protein E [Dyadobacter frigoris]